MTLIFRTTGERMKEIEILAPAGSYESLVAAVNAGCDAVYIGGSKFGARAYANNLSDEDLLKAIDYVHLHDKKIYLTINTLLKNSELKNELYTFVKKFYEQGLDAVIIQDIGVMNFIHKYFPDLPIHASTQMTLTGVNGVNVLKDTGVTRIVTSRELSLTEIKQIRDNTDLEIESFVHGALCFCYSGQCFMSSMLGGRSGNRGRCAQTCRMPYNLKEGITKDKSLNHQNKVVMNKEGNLLSSKNEKYLLSPKDICTLTIIPELVQAGIDSFKIEGRMKKPEYTALVAHLYRKYVDLYLELGDTGYKEYLKKNKKTFDRDVMNLMDLYNRGGFTSGYYQMHNGKTMMSSNRPNHSGVFVGEVTSVKGINASIKLKEDVNSQDILEIRTNNEEAYEFTLKNGAKKGETIHTNFIKKYQVKPGQHIYRTKNKQLIETIREELIKKEHKIKISGHLLAKIGQPLQLTLHFKDIEISVVGDQVEQALKQPMTKEKLYAQMNKTNTTSFQFEQFDIESDEQIFIPVVKLNELRREGIDALTKVILNTYRRTLQNNINEKEDQQLKVSKAINQIEFGDDTNQINKKTGISVLLSQTSYIDEVIKYKEIDNIYLESHAESFTNLQEIMHKVQNNGINFYLVLPSIFRKETYDLFLKHKNTLKDSAIKGFIIKNFEEYQFIHEIIGDTSNKDIILDYNVYTMNQEAKEFWKSKGIHHYTASVELNFNELKDLGIEDSDFIVYGHLPLMVTAQCLIKNSKGCTKNSQMTTLVDRYNKNFYVKNNCKYCYNTIYNGSPISLLGCSKEIEDLKPKNIRIDFTIEEIKKVKQILELSIQVFHYHNTKEISKVKDFTRGHFKRGIE